MVKRKRDEEDARALAEPLLKQSRVIGNNRFLDLSDELVLRTLFFLSVQELVVAERVCKRFQRLASDNEIWKEKFYLRFVRPRARRIPAISTLSQHEKDSQALYYASKSAKWLEYHMSPDNASQSDWKRRYKIKLNWTKGRCKAREVALDTPQQPRILVRIHRGKIYTTDERKLRSYSQRTRSQILNTHYWEGGKRPTSMAVGSRANCVYIAIGFSDGSLEILEEQQDGTCIPLIQYKFEATSPISNLAVAWPYVLAMSTDRRLTLLSVNDDPPLSTGSVVTLLASLKSGTLLLPVSLSVRKVSGTLIASIAYSFSRLNAGWCLGLQEIRIGLNGGILGSRLTSTVDTPMQDFPFRKGAISSRSACTAPFALHPNLMNPPSSLSHSGCYILAGLPDNTLMVYTVVSNHEKLEISAGRRLFGHTSSVSGAEISDRGKALSISAKGDEIRVWELEDLLSSWSLQKASTQLRPQYSNNDLNVALAKRGVGLGLALREMKDELAWSRHWVGFDEEQVVVLGERDKRQILSCYDFA